MFGKSFSLKLFYLRNHRNSIDISLCKKLSLKGFNDIFFYFCRQSNLLVDIILAIVANGYRFELSYAKLRSYLRLNIQVRFLKKISTHLISWNLIPLVIKCNQAHSPFFALRILYHKTGPSTLKSVHRSMSNLLLGLVNSSHLQKD